jgi:NADPH:quinone reductase-like Zn-dependent oxidoreductase
VQKPTIQDSEALVRVKAFGLNRMDVLQREGHYPLPPQAGPILGVEFSGIVEKLGGAAEATFKIGDEVFGLAYGGSPVHLHHLSLLSSKIPLGHNY